MYSWKETSPGCFQRAFDPLERYHRDVVGFGAEIDREHWSVTATARFYPSPSLGDAELALRHAWKTMRYDHPQIASVRHGEMKVYRTQDAAELATWLDETFMVHAAKSADELVPTLRRCPLAVLYYLPASSEIAFRSSHWRIDGIGFLQFLHSFFQALAKPRMIVFGDESKNLSPALSEALGVSTEVTPEITAAANELTMKYINGLPSIGLVPKSSRQSPGATHRCHLKFPTAMTKAIIAKCKEAGTSITAATDAALILATQELRSPDPTATNYASWCPANIRQYCKAPYNSSAHPVTVYHTGLPVVVKPTTFSEIVSQLNAILKQKFSEKELNLLDRFVDNNTELAIQAAATNPPSPTEPMLSSLGVIDRYIQPKYEGGVEVIDFWMGLEVLTKQVQAFVWTWQDRLQLSACFNEEYYDEEYVQMFLVRVKSIILENLGVAEI